MNKKDALELKRRFTKDCTINRLAGCYVDCNKQVVLKFNENFLNLQEEEFYKYLEIAKKTLSGTIGNNLLELKFAPDEEEAGGKQKFLLGLRESKLSNEELLDRLYEQIIAKYMFAGNYLILVFNDNYDVMTRTKDNFEVDESEEVYEYLLVSICPVELSKPGLGYRMDENRIGARVRDWVVGVPDIGFLFPAFDNRSADVNHVDYFIKDPKEPHEEFVEEVLGCGTRRTAYEQRMTFGEIVKKAYRDNEDKAEEVLIDIQESFKARVEEDEAEAEDKAFTAPVVLTGDIIDEVMEENKIDPDDALKIRKVVLEEFADEMPEVANLVDERAIKANAPVKREKELIREVMGLKDQVRTAQAQLAAGAYDEASAEWDVLLRVSPDKESEVHAEVIGDRRYILIPADEDELINVNGKEIKL